MAYDMAAQDTRLFLDTHPTCDEALEYYNMCLIKKDGYLKEYESRFGAMTQNSLQDKKYSWLCCPWPWQF